MLAVPKVQKIVDLYDDDALQLVLLPPIEAEDRRVQSVLPITKVLSKELL